MNQDKEAKLFSLVDILEPLSSEEIGWFGERAPRIHLERYEILYTPTHDNKLLYMLLEGQVRIYNMVGQHELTLDIVEARTMFGEAALAGRPQGVYAQALEASRIALVNLSDLEHLVQANPKVGLKIAGLLGQRLHTYASRMADIALKDIPARLASLILHLVESEGIVTREGHHKVRTRYTHEQLATMIGTRRVPVTRAFTKLKEAGAVQLRRRHVYVTDFEALKRIAQVQQGVASHALAS